MEHRLLEEFERKILRECAEIILKNDSENDPQGYRPAEEIEKIAEFYHEESEKNDKLSSNEVPERYSEFWFNLHKIPGPQYFVQVKFLHTLRRHPMSPDGWAAVETSYILHIEADTLLVEIYELIDKEVR
jgi:hypothetical protein